MTVVPLLEDAPSPFYAQVPHIRHNLAVVDLRVLCPIDIENFQEAPLHARRPWKPSVA